MNINDAVACLAQEKQKLEQQLGDALSDFHRRTGVRVTDIRFDDVYRDMNHELYTRCFVDIELPS